MPSPRNQGPDQSRVDWLAILRILLVQVLVLLALATAFVRYVNWSSDQAWAEFSRTVTVPAPDAKTGRPSASPMRAVKNRIPCARRV